MVTERAVGLGTKHAKIDSFSSRNHQATPLNFFEKSTNFCVRKEGKSRRSDIKTRPWHQTCAQFINHSIISSVLDKLHLDAILEFIGYLWEIKMKPPVST